MLKGSQTMKKFLYAMLAVVGLSILFPTAIVSASTPPAPNVVEDASGTLIVVSAWWVTLIAGLLIPLANGLLTKISDKAAYKAYLTLALGVGWSLFSTGVLEDGTAVFSGQTLQTAVMTLLISFFSYGGIFKPMGLTSSAIAIPDRHTEGRSIMVPGKLAFVGLRK
jgi:hypothetical protein